MSSIKVLLAEDHTILRKGLCSLLENEYGIEVVGEAENGREAIEKTELLHPDVLVLDISMPLLNGIEVTRQLKKKFPDLKILILTMHATDEFVFEVLNAGAKGYVIKKAAPDELVSAIHAVSVGQSYFSPEISKMLLDRVTETGPMHDESIIYKILTEREREILQLVAEGHSSREISEMLFISIKTVENHRANIMEKLGLHNLAELIKYAINKGIIQL
ncbi:MAG: response regulator transcription factor [Lentimicrobiaceae bacterium]|jgi:DNA-binding NarL/FixJ family response regulator